MLHYETIFQILKTLNNIIFNLLNRHNMICRIQNFIINIFVVWNGCIASFLINNIPESYI